jgi:hypothetical protein
MGQSLLFLPDISGFTQFVQNTEVEHSQHVISELLDILAEANMLDLKLAEVEGDALFFYREEIPSQEKILAQVEHMFSVFYSHLRLLEKNRICPCNACSTAPNLELKVVAHAGDLQFITVQGKRKPFGNMVIEVHRLLKNSVSSDNYVLLSTSLADNMKMSKTYSSNLFQFEKGQDIYDNRTIDYIYSNIEKNRLTLSPFSASKRVEMKSDPDIVISSTFNTSAEELLELITNYSYRHLWVKGVDKFEYNEHEVTRLETPHVCVIDGKSLDFVVVIKDGAPGELIYGELTKSIGVIDSLYQFFIVKPVSDKECELIAESYFETKSIFKRLIVSLAVKRVFSKNNSKNLKNLQELVSNH